MFVFLFPVKFSHLISFLEFFIFFSSLICIAVSLPLACTSICVVCRAILLYGTQEMPILPRPSGPSNLISSYLQYTSNCINHPVLSNSCSAYLPNRKDMRSVFLDVFVRLQYPTNQADEDNDFRYY